MLKGEKVILREIRESDLDRLTEFNNNFDIWVLADDDAPAPRTRKQAKRNSTSGSRREPSSHS